MAAADFGQPWIGDREPAHGVGVVAPRVCQHAASGRQGDVVPDQAIEGS
jgi:hypothetical protein